MKRQPRYLPLSKYLFFSIIFCALTLPFQSLQCGSARDNEMDLQALKQSSRGFNHVAQKALGAVVSVHVKGHREAKQQMMLPPGFQDDFFRRFFHNPQQQAPQTFSGLGSGVIVSKDGYIVTNEHVIRDAETIEVITDDDQKMSAELVGADPDTDLAILKVESKKTLPFLKLGNSDQLMIGEWVIAIGTPRNPLLKSTLTVGVVSAKGRSDLDLTNIEEYIQTDAAINMGNSGGPLLNIDGEIVGINNSLISTDGTYIGIGFAIPSNIVKHVSEQLIKEGKVKRGFVGIYYKPVTEAIAEAYQLPNQQGVVVTDVLKDSPADKAGLRYGDVVVAVNGKEITNPKVFYKEVAFTSPGNTLKLEVNREGKTLHLSLAVTLKETEAKEVKSSKASFGITLSEDENSASKGFIISSIEPLSPAHKAGIKPQSRLVGIGRLKPKSIEEAYEALHSAWENKKVLLLIEHDEQVVFVKIEV